MNDLRDLANEVLKELERIGDPVEFYVFGNEFNAGLNDVFVALEFLFRQNKAAKYTLLRPSSDGVRAFDFWTTIERAREIEAAWIKGRRNVD